MNAKISIISQLVIVLSILVLPVSNSLAKIGCCSKHGGVVGCDARTGHQLCKDGTPSPTCPCEGKEGKKGFFGGILTTPKTSTTTSTTTKPTTKTIKAKETTTKKAKPTTTKATKEKFSTQGCCSRHGGVGRCNKSSGYYMCKDKTLSSCRCS